VPASPLKACAAIAASAPRLACYDELRRTPRGADRGARSPSWRPPPVPRRPCNPSAFMPRAPRARNGHIASALKSSRSARAQTVILPLRSRAGSCGNSMARTRSWPAGTRSPLRVLHSAAFLMTTRRVARHRVRAAYASLRLPSLATPKKRRALRPRLLGLPSLFYLELRRHVGEQVAAQRCS